MQSIALIDYGSGNLRSAEKALLKASSGLDGARDIVVTADPDIIAKADAVVLPGVGAAAEVLPQLLPYAGVQAWAEPPWLALEEPPPGY